MSLDTILVEYRLKIDALEKDVAEVKKTLGKVDDSVKTSAANASTQLGNIQTQVSGKLTASFASLGKVIAATFAIQGITNFISSSIELATRAQEIKSEFDKLNSPYLLANLRKATQGTLSDLKLMEVALRADKLGVPMEKLGKIIEFAKVRADALGKSTEELTDILVQGIGIKGTRALVQVGISQEEFSKEVKKTGDYFTALDNIMTKTLDNAGEGFESVADKQDRLKASIENTKVEIGSKLLPVIDDLLVGINNAILGFERLFNVTNASQSEGFNQIIDMFSDGSKPAEGFAAEIADVTESIRKLNEENKGSDSGLAKIFGAKSVREYHKTLGLLEGQLMALKALQDQENRSTEASKNSFEDAGKEAKVLTKEIDPLVLAYQRLGKAIGQSFEALNNYRDVLPEETIKTIGIDTDKTADALLKADAAAIKLKGSLGTLNGELVNTDTSIETAKLAWDDYANAVLSVFESINQAYSYGTDYRMSLLQEELNQGLISEETYEKKRKQYAREEAKRAKALAILSITVDTARAVMAALATGNVPLSILAGATGLIELGVVANQPIPEFKKGVIDFKGKGTETSDSNLVRISKGESVITAKATKENKPILEAINKNKFDEFITSVYLKEKKSNVAVSWDDYRLLLELKKSTYASKENTQQIVRAIKETRKQHRFNA